MAERSGGRTMSSGPRRRWPGPAGHQLSESVAKYEVVDMFAKACRGDSTKDVIATAAGQLKQIYKAR